MKWLSPSQKGIGTPIKKYQQVLSILRSINREDKFSRKKVKVLRVGGKCEGGSFETGWDQQQNHCKLFCLVNDVKGRSIMVSGQGRFRLQRSSCRWNSCMVSLVSSTI